MKNFELIYDLHFVQSFDGLLPLEGIFSLPMLRGGGGGGGGGGGVSADIFRKF